MESNNDIITQRSLHPDTAQVLSHSTISVPMMEEITPRWLLTLLPWVPVEAGVYRVNKRKKCYVDSKNVPFDNRDCTAVGPGQLCKIPLFKDMDRSLVEQISTFFVMEQYDAESTITKVGNEGDKLFIVAKGNVEVSAWGSRGKKVKIGSLTDGQYSDINAFIQKSNRPISMQALAPSVIFSLDRTKLQNVINQSPQSIENFNHALQKWSYEKVRSNEYGEKRIELISDKLREHTLPQTFPDYEDVPCEYRLNSVQTILKVNSQVTDIFNKPIDQLQEQMRMTVEAMKEKQEWEMINNKEFGLVNSVAPEMRMQPRKGAPTPDDMDALLAKVWKKPAFFLAHPQAIAAFGRECTKRGVPPATVNFCGSPFITWRGVPIVPCDKLLVNEKCRNHSCCGTTNILLMRVGEKEQGVIGLHQPGIPDEKFMPSLSVKFAGIDNMGITSYVMSLYFSTVVLTDDALGMLEDVEVGYYHDYE
ncbi:family 2B encapsulin nanocompartment shell protein [Petroclostridium sp. X23]|uniref:family 2B encapsulin nanocompartment shell protein n=1 Tax=Petroclostridium sp. X23 TaxID=3045146 RepID=UPI0024AD81AF|nr:family 2B encapsulin nanocompartment shell protein [Petroclostridium sp. X23]WHH58823.1 family 2B encapsulin nanocompartment shell protein [Petroclostridium sp. X23]